MHLRGGRASRSALTPRTPRGSFFGSPARPSPPVVDPGSRAALSVTALSCDGCSEERTREYCQLETQEAIGHVCLALVGPTGQNLFVTLSLHPALVSTNQLLDDLDDVLTAPGAGSSAARLAQFVLTLAVFESRHRRVTLEAPGTRHEPSATVWRDEIAGSPTRWLSTLRHHAR